MLFSFRQNISIFCLQNSDFIGGRSIRLEWDAYDLSTNPKGVELSTGGIYKKAEYVLIAGRVAAFTDLSKEAMQIYKEIVKAMNKCFTKKIIFLYQKGHC